MRRSTVVLALIATLSATAQTAKVRVKVKASVDHQLEEGSTLCTVVKGDEGAFVALRVPADAAVLGGRPQAGMPWDLLVLDRATMAPIKQAAPKLIYGETPVAVETIGRHQRKVWLYGSKVDLERGGVQLVHQEMSPRSLVGVKGAQELAFLPFDRLGRPAAWFTAGAALGLVHTPGTDTTRFMLSMDPRTTQSEGAPWFTAVFRKDMSLHWARSLALEPGARDAQVAASVLDADGVVWHLVKWVWAAPPKEEGAPGHAWAVVRMDSTGQRQAMIDLPGAPYAQDVRMALRKDGRIALAGIFGETPAKTVGSGGMFFTTMDRKELAFGPFSQQPLAKDLAKPKKGEPQDELAMMAEDLQLFSDGGMLLLANERGVRTTQGKNLRGEAVTRHTHLTRDLHACRVGPAGEPVWYKVLDRSVSVDKAGRGSPVAFVQSDQLYVLMNDDLRNEELRKNGEAVPLLDGGGEALLLEFKPDGTSKARSVVNGGSDVAIVLSERRWQASANETVMLAAFKLQGERSFPLSVQFEQETKR